jgi:hypothetical protein
VREANSAQRLRISCSWKKKNCPRCAVVTSKTSTRWNFTPGRGAAKIPGEGFHDTNFIGDDQIEYEDEDPRIRAMFEEALARRGVKSRMESAYRAV